MAKKQNKTVYQKLNSLFGPEGVNVPQKETNRYSIDKGEILRTTDKDEFELAKKQAMQNAYLSSQWQKVDNEMYQQSIHYETTRIGAYSDYEAMEFYPEIAAALDIMMEECLDGSTVIPLLNGNEYTIETLYNNNITDFWVYSIDLKENKIKPSKVDKVILKGFKDVYRVILDDGSDVLCTDNHKWLSNDNKWVNTSNLKHGDSLKFVSRKINHRGYEMVSLTNFKGDTKFTHKLVAENEMMNIKKSLLLSNKSEHQKIVIHHKSFNKLNNEPNQLQYMFWNDHQKLHTDLNKKRWESEDFSNKMKKIFSETAKNTWNNFDDNTKKNKIDKIQSGLKNKLKNLTSDEKKIFLNRGGKHNGMYGVRRYGKNNPNYDTTTNHINDINEEEYINFIISVFGNRRKAIMNKFNINEHNMIKYNKFICEKYKLKRIEDLDFIKNDGFNIQTIKNFIVSEKYPYRVTKKYCELYNIKPSKLTSFLNRRGYNNWSDVVNTIGNHRVVSVDYVGVKPVYDLVNSSVDENFGVKCGSGMIISHNCTTPNEKGSLVNVYSESDRVKSVIEDLLFNRLDIHTTLPMWARNVPIREDSIIPLLDGTEITIKELSNRIKNNEEVWSYAVQDGTKAIVPSKIIWCDLTRKNSELYRVTLDDGTYIDTTPDHEYMLRDGSFKRADKLTEGQSLMPFYTKKSNGYEKIYNPSTGTYKFTHKIISHEFSGLDKDYIKTKPVHLGKTKEKHLLNHKVVSVIKLNEKSDVYCLEAVGPNNEQDRHNFPVLGKDINDSYSRSSGVFLSNCKYGDNFLYLNIDDKAGVIGAKQMPNFEMERRESNLVDALSRNNKNAHGDSSEYDNKVKFYWKGKDVEFNSWQIAHFRLLGDDRKLPYGTCLKGDTRINTEFGVKEIKDIEVGTNVWSFNTKTQEKELSPILDKIMSGTKEVFKISTRHNYIDASKEHKILVATNDGEFIYKNVCDLQIGDLLVLNKNEHTNKKIKIDKTKPNNNKNGWSNNINNIPDYVTEEFAQLFGFLIGNGWLTTNNSCVEFTLGTDVETNKYYISLLEKFSGNKVITNDKQATLHSKMLKTILERIGFSGKSYEKRIPNWVFEMDTVLQKSFVAGLIDADGWITKDQWVIGLHIELNNKELIEDLKILLQRIGYKSGSIINRLIKEPIIDDQQIKTVRESHILTFFDSYLTQMQKYEFKNRKTDNFILEPIQSIQSIGEFETYDIYVKNENHNFYANNVVVHNSMLEKARRIWKQCILTEDAMLVYRVTRAPERRVYKVFVGNIDDVDVPAYVNNIANKFKRTPVIDPQTGQIDLRYNQMSNDQDFFIPVRSEDAANPIDTLPGACLSLDTRIPLLDGRTLELSEIINEYNNGKELWGYSINPETGSVVPGKITWAGITRKNTDVLKITLDNGQTIVCTPDHKFPTKDNGKKEAKDLLIGESLYSFNKDYKKINNSKSKYEMVYDHNKNKYVYTHRMVGNFMKNLNKHSEFVYDKSFINEGKNTIHHKNINRFNNNPNNLLFMNNTDHYKYHSNNINKFNSLGGKALSEKLKNDDEFREIFSKKRSEISKNMWANKTLDERININKKQSIGIINYFNNLSEDDRFIRSEKSRKNMRLATIKFQEILKTDSVFKKELYNKTSKSLKIVKNTKESKDKRSEISKQLFKSHEYREKVFKNQKIKYNNRLLTILSELFKDGNSLDEIIKIINDKTHEFNVIFNNLNKNNKHLDKKSKGITKNNIYKLVKYFNYKNWVDFKNKISLYNHKITNIEWLDNKIDTGTITIDGSHEFHDYHTFAIESGIFTYNSNLSDIGDIEYLQRKLFTALRVPKSFLGFDEPQGEGKNLALQDIRFSRTINRIQQAMIMELNKIIIIHLYLLGFEDDLDNFNITLNNPSTQAEMLKIEHLQGKVSLYAEAVRDAGNGFAPMSMTRAKRDILGMTNDEIKQDLLEQRIEKAASAELENTAKIIKKTGFFDIVDNIYGDPNADVDSDNDGDDDKPGGSNDGGGFAGGGGFGGEDLDMGGEDLESDDTEGSDQPEEFGGDEDESAEPEEFGGIEDFDGAEGFVKNINNLLLEEKDILSKKLNYRKDKYRNIYMDRLMDSLDGDIKSHSSIKMQDKSVKINENIDNMVNGINKMLED